MYRHICTELSNRQHFTASVFPHDFSRTYMCSLSIILLLIVPEVERCSLIQSITGSDFPAEYQWTLQGAFEINHSTLLLADSRPTYSFFLSLSYYIVVAVYEWFLHHSCLTLPSCHSGSADDTDAKPNGRLRSRSGGEVWDVKGSDL